MALSTTFRTAAGVVSSFVSSITLLLFTFLASIYMSLGAQNFHEGILRSAPACFRPELVILLARIERTWKAFFRGELTLYRFSIDR